jgi:hypothetical protein
MLLGASIPKKENNRAGYEERSQAVLDGTASFLGAICLLPVVGVVLR